jgi:hypothetical protein
MAVGANAAQKQLYSAKILYGLFVQGTFRLQVGGIPVEHMYILFGYVDVIEKVVPHKRIVTLGV